MAITSALKAGFALSLVLAVGSLTAARGAGHPPSARPTPGNERAACYHRFLDADGDGSVSREELAAGQDFALALLGMDFATADQDGDGRLSRVESAQYLRFAEKEMSAPVPEAQDPDWPLAVFRRREDGLHDEVLVLIDDLEGLEHPDFVEHVLDHPGVYPHVYKEVGDWTVLLPTYTGWVRKVIAHQWRHSHGPSRPAVPASPGRPRQPRAPRAPGAP